MKQMFIIISLSAFYIMQSIMPASAAAWLQPKDSTEIHLTNSQSDANGEMNGTPIPYEREYKQIYAEYGLSAKRTLIGKYYTGTSGEGFTQDRNSSDGFELGLRQNLKWTSGNLTPFGAAKILKYFSPDKKIRRYKQSSYDIGLGHYSYNNEATTSLNLQIARADKIETRHKNPLSVQAEMISIYALSDNGNQQFRLISRMQFGYKNWHFGYERLDGRVWSKNPYYESLWFWEVGIPIKQHQFQIKWGHDRTQANIPVETFVQINLEMSFDTLAQIWRGGLK